MSILKSTLIVSVGIATSRIFGFIRDALIARYIGASVLSDIFFASFRLPNFFRRIFAEGAFNNAFVPIFIKYCEKPPNKASKTNPENLDSGNQNSQQFARNIFSLLLYVLLIFTLILQIAMPFVVKILFPGFIYGSEKFIATVDLSRITIFYLITISLASLCSAILNSLGRFYAASSTPVILNLTLILMMIFAGNLFENYAILLAWAVAIAGMLQFLWVFIFTVKAKFLLYPIYPVFCPQTKKFAKKLLPAVLGANVLQINLLVDSIFASTITGAISYLYYADRINQLPLAMIGIALSVALLPNLSKKIAENNNESAISLQNLAVAIAIILAVPASIFLITFAEPVIATLFQRGKFGEQETISVSKALSFYSLGLPSFILVKIFEPGFFARGNTKIPMYIAIFCVSLNVVLNIIFHYCQLGYVGIILAAIISSYGNLILLIWQLHRQKFFFFDRQFNAKIKPMLIIIAVAVAVAIVIRSQLYSHQHLNNSSIRLIISMATFASIYFALLYRYRLLAIIFRKKS
jgi:putative peptidoglycan lipid II flippase